MGDIGNWLNLKFSYLNELQKNNVFKSITVPLWLFVGILRQLKDKSDPLKLPERGHRYIGLLGLRRWEFFEQTNYYTYI